jgi:glutamate synthase domain-containing protein 1
MATESAVTTEGAHPFSTGADQCLVHNGSLANHNALRRKLRRDGVRSKARTTPRSARPT